MTHHPFSKRRIDLSMGILATLANPSRAHRLANPLSPPQPRPHNAVLAPLRSSRQTSENSPGKNDIYDPIEWISETASMCAKEPQTVQLKPHQISLPALEPNESQKRQAFVKPYPRNLSAIDKQDGSQPSSVTNRQVVDKTHRNTNDHSSSPINCEGFENEAAVPGRRPHQDESPSSVSTKRRSRSESLKLSNASKRRSLPASTKMTTNDSSVHTHEQQAKTPNFIDRHKLPSGKCRRSTLPTDLSSAKPAITNPKSECSDLSPNTKGILKMKKEVFPSLKSCSRRVSGGTKKSAGNFSVKPSSKVEPYRTIVKKRIRATSRSKARSFSPLSGKRKVSVRSARSMKTRIRETLIQVGGGSIISGHHAQSDNQHIMSHKADQEEPPEMLATNSSPNSSLQNSTIISKAGRRSSSTSESRSQRITSRRSKRLAQNPQADDVIVIDISDEEGTGSDGKQQAEGKDDCDTAAFGLATLSLQSEKQRLGDLPPCPFLDSLSEEEEAQLLKLYRQKNQKEIKYIPSARIVLRGEDFKRLRGVRWLNDEVINAYMSLINVRNDSIFEELPEDERKNIPQTYVFNTFFYTRLTSGSARYDYSGVRRWTGRNKVDVMKQDLLLFPVNLGNHHWVLAGIDRPRRSFFYLDSMARADKSGVLRALRRWYYDEVEDKYGEDVATQMELETWPSAHNRYMIRRAGVLPAKLEPRIPSPRLSRIPMQTDGGSCGVFITKIADCLSLGIKIYFNQTDIHLVRSRMALDLLRGQLVM
ncbi:unnamed protein product [Agarophyton chilense]